MIPMSHRWTANLAALLCVAVMGRLGAAEGTGAEYFEKNVRPLLVQKCQVCHSSGTQPASGLALDSREAVLKGGSRGPAIVPGRPEGSLLLNAVTNRDAKLKMPPGIKLKDAEIAVLAEWVRLGAPWGAPPAASGSAAKFWAFAPPEKPPAPSVTDKGWARSPIDRFVREALEAKGLQPAPPADKRTLIRRATLDLLGLPPTPEEVEAFLKDDSPDAFARVVDRLLASPRYGERWGRHWLDVARYSDSNGLDENLVFRHAHRYRDYVIRAFNQDKPYNLFVQEQLAGDLLGGDDLASRLDRRVATGFLSIGAKMLAEDDPVKMEMDIVDEQLDTASRTFMGLTVGCARCHDHKFDPIPTADYYAMAGIFKSSKTMENFRVVAKWHEYVLLPDEEVRKADELDREIEAKRTESQKLTDAANDRLMDEARSRTGAYLRAAGEALRSAAIKLRPRETHLIERPAASFDSGNVPKQLEKGSVNRNTAKDGPSFAEYRIQIPAAGDYQVDILEEETGAGTADLLINGVLMRKGLPPVTNRVASPESGGWSVLGVFPFREGENTVRLENSSRFPYFEKVGVSPSEHGADPPLTTAQLAAQYDVNLSFLDQWIEELDRSKGAPNSILFGWLEFGNGWNEWTSPVASQFSGFGQTRERLAGRYQELFDDALARWNALDGERRKAKDAKLDDPAAEALREFLFAENGVFRAPADSRKYFPAEVQEQLKSIEAERTKLETARPDLPRAMGVTEGKPMDLPIHVRGSHWTLGTIVPRGFLSAVPIAGIPPIGPSESGRLQFARWLTDPAHPLTSRVMVNRLWRWHFGRGIVPSVDNFGRLGEPPTNQPLLDWLAQEFIARGWSVKGMHRLMMLSNTYQMSSTYNTKAAEADPNNLLLWRMPRQRLEAEAIRDAILAVSGTLDVNSTSGSLLRFKDREYVTNISKRSTVDYDVNRRSVYLPVIRSAMYDVFQAFDVADPATPNGDRGATVIAQQALFMMNSTVAVDQSAAWADVLLKQGGSDRERIHRAYLSAFSRPASASEVDRALTLINRVARALEQEIADDGERRKRTWQSFCKMIFAASEFIYIN
jgi:hypothetical protein